MKKQRASNDVETQCGPFVGIGSKKQTAPVEGVVNEVPAAGYVSYAELNDYIDNGSAIMVRQKALALRLPLTMKARHT
ncbi:hypothetical protein KRR40_12640 [Niabella defluvii]|nr:hypothetical protein KRR40_12640 [Niabella sp. I65]